MADTLEKRGYVGDYIGSRVYGLNSLKEAMYMGLCKVVVQGLLRGILEIQTTASVAFQECGPLRSLARSSKLRILPHPYEL